jgi:hypothetical protein
MWKSRKFTTDKNYDETVIYVDHFRSDVNFLQTHNEELSTYKLMDLIEKGSKQWW